MLDLELKHLETLIEFIKEENEQQLEVWGVQNHTPAEWMMIVMEELGELTKTIWDYMQGRDDIRPFDVVVEGIQTTTVLLKVVEMFYAVHREENPERKEVSNETSTE